MATVEDLERLVNERNLLESIAAKRLEANQKAKQQLAKDNLKILVDARKQQRNDKLAQFKSEQQQKQQAEQATPIDPKIQLPLEPANAGRQAGGFALTPQGIQTATSGGRAVQAAGGGGTIPQGAIGTGPISAERASELGLSPAQAQGATITRGRQRIGRSGILSRPVEQINIPTEQQAQAAADAADTLRRENKARRVENATNFLVNYGPTHGPALVAADTPEEVEKILLTAAQDKTTPIISRAKLAEDLQQARIATEQAKRLEAFAGLEKKVAETRKAQLEGRALELEQIGKLNLQTLGVTPLTGASLVDLQQEKRQLQSITERTELPASRRIVELHEIETILHANANPITPWNAGTVTIYGVDSGFLGGEDKPVIGHSVAVPRVMLLLSQLQADPTLSTQESLAALAELEAGNIPLIRNERGLPDIDPTKQNHRVIGYLASIFQLMQASGAKLDVPGEAGTPLNPAPKQLAPAPELPDETRGFGGSNQGAARLREAFQAASERLSGRGAALERIRERRGF